MSRRTLTVLLALLTVLALLPSGAAARGHRHPHHVKGVVSAVSASGHRVTIATGTRGRHHGKSKHFSVNIAGASISGGGGAVNVGDTVDATVVDGSGGAEDATSVDVTSGGPSGGHGAVICGVVTAVDPTAGTITLTPHAHGFHDGGGGASSSSAPASVVVQITGTTVVAVGDSSTTDANVAGIKAGDRVLVFTTDPTASPVVAVAVYDDGRAGEGHHHGGGGEPGNGLDPIGGQVLSVDVAGGSLMMQPAPVDNGSGPAGPAQPLRVVVTSSTKIGTESEAGDAAITLADLKAGDRIVVVPAGPPAADGSITADHIVRRPAEDGPPGPQVHVVTGQVVSVDAAGGKLTIAPDPVDNGSGTPSPTSLVVVVTAATHLGGESVVPGTPLTLADFRAGDRVAVMPAGPPNPDGSINAAGVYRRGSDS